MLAFFRIQKYCKKYYGQIKDTSLGSKMRPAYKMLTKEAVIYKNHFYFIV